MRPKVLTGQRVAISINGDAYAFGSVLDYAIDTQVTEFSGIDSVMPTELAPDRLRVTMSLRIFRTIDNDPSADGVLFQKGLSSEDQQSGFAMKEYLTIEVRDRQTDQTIMFIPRALVSSRSASIDAENIMTETWTIVGIGFKGTETPSGNILKRLAGSVGF